MNRPVDWREREKARDPNASWIVQAPAGSGKTELLTQRMLGLLARVENPENVIAITFTRKAAAEMRHRIADRLKAAHDEPAGTLEPHEQTSRELALAALENDKQRGWNLLQQPSRLRVRTIDSLCSELARQLPLLSGLGGGQQIAEDAGALYRIAAAGTMAILEDDSDTLQADVIRVLDRYDNQYDRLVELLTGMLGQREQWIGHLLSIRKNGGFDRDALEDSLELLIESELRTARDSLPQHLLCEFPRFLRYARTNLAPDETPVRDLLAACGGAASDYLDLPVTAQALPHWITMISYLLTKGGGWWANATTGMGFPAPSNARGEDKLRCKEWKDEFRLLLDSLRDNEELLSQLNTIRKLPQPGYDQESWESLESLMRILIRAHQEWKLVMAETGETDFSEIAARAIEALGHADEPSNLALRLDYRIEHLLVDEFQDTSLSQIRLLEKLTAGWSRDDGRTLFLVGDPMQSIYRFRKAEVSLFIKAFEGHLFQQVNLQPLQLMVNFRSSTPVVDWVNQVFPRVMPQHSDPVKDAVHYSESRARPGAPGSGAVAVHLLPKRDDEKEARHVIDVITASEPDRSIAILVRSRNHAAAVLGQLDRSKLNDPRFRYRAIDFNPLAETPAIQDLVSLALALTQPADRLAWFAVLRAPWCGLDLADLDALAGGNTDRIILDALTGCLDPENGAAMKLSPDGRRRLQRIAPLLLAAASRRGRETARTLIESAWTALGGPVCVQNESELADAATFFDLLEQLEAESLPIDRDTLEERMQNLYAEPDARADGNLQVMTIFAAKGLQFDTVIMPGLNRGTGNDRGKLLHWFELAGQDSIVMSPMQTATDRSRGTSEGNLIRFISDVEKRRQGLENGRLLYVATTRAVRDLHLFAAVEPKKDGTFKPGGGTLLSELWPAIKAVHRPAEKADASDADADANAVQYPLPQEFRRLAVDWRPPEPPAPINQAAAVLADARDYIEFRWAGEDARLTGNLVHRLLQQIAVEGIAAWTAAGGMARQEDWCRRQLLTQGALGEKAESIIKRTATAISNCLASRHGKWLLAPHPEAECEWALTAIVENQPQSLVLDRTFVENGTRWIIDYKTSSHSGGDLEGFLQNESDRYREQLKRYHQALAINESRPIRTALYFPLLDRLVEIQTGG
ncbi:MAG: UvrD-helicase domain-containing protein [Xanthomonadales bacterium]|nr:UvrD-helicase domain-containing protein [Gammaproteobacteria bacterium]NND58087.1 UvrD-helicase domain-containing protein [Xanthomonadales bacterium]NNK51762.1 UvrD-helicase domain-containing protein [Xanthomonadales bacterium]